MKGNLPRILVPRNRRFLVTWSWNEGLWKQLLPDVRKFPTSGRAFAGFTTITAHFHALVHNVFFSLTLSSLQRVASLESFKNTELSQLGFTDNLELKGEDINRNQLNTLLVCRTETGNRRIIVWVIRLAKTNAAWKSKIAEIEIMRGKVSLKRYLVACPANAILFQNAFWNKTIHVLCY